MHNDQFTILVEMLKSFQAENNRQFAEIRQERKEDKAENNQRFDDVNRQFAEIRQERKEDKAENNRQFAELRKNQERLEHNQERLEDKYEKSNDLLMDIWKSRNSVVAKTTWEFIWKTSLVNMIILLFMFAVLKVGL